MALKPKSNFLNFLNINEFDEKVDIIILFLPSNQATGYNNTCITACAASTQAIGEAAEIIKNNKADIVITGGAESGICEYMYKCLIFIRIIKLFHHVIYSI